MPTTEKKWCCEHCTCGIVNPHHECCHSKIECGCLPQTTHVQTPIQEGWESRLDSYWKSALHGGFSVEKEAIKEEIRKLVASSEQRGRDMAVGYVAKHIIDKEEFEGRQTQWVKDYSKVLMEARNLPTKLK